jgi:hypothetical protein
MHVQGFSPPAFASSAFAKGLPATAVGRRVTVGTSPMRVVEIPPPRGHIVRELLAAAAAAQPAGYTLDARPRLGRPAGRLGTPAVERRDRHGVVLSEPFAILGVSALGDESVERDPDPVGVRVPPWHLLLRVEARGGDADRRRLEPADAAVLVDADPDLPLACGRHVPGRRDGGEVALEKLPQARPQSRFVHKWILACCISCNRSFTRALDALELL